MTTRTRKLAPVVLTKYGLFTPLDSTLSICLSNNISFDEVVGPSKSVDISATREKIIYELRTTFNMGYDEIGEMISKGHTSVYNAFVRYCKKNNLRSKP